MSAGIVILIIFLILIVLGLTGVAIWYFGFYRKKKSPSGDDTKGKNVAFTFTQTGLTVNFVAAPGLTNWSWNFGDNSPSSNSENPIYTYKQSGNYTVTLTATTSSGSSNSSTQTVQVNSGGSTGGTNFTYTISGLAVQFTDTSTNNPTSRSWDFGDGTGSTLTNPAHTYSSTGTYNVKLTVTISSGTDSDTQNVTVGGPSIIPSSVASILTRANTYNSNDTIQFSVPQGSDKLSIGSINGGVWTADSAGSYMIFADATNNSGGGSIQILQNNSSILGTQLTRGTGKSTLLTMGYAQLNNDDTIQVNTLKEIAITSPDPYPNATSHLIIQKLLPNTSTTYLTNGGKTIDTAVINFSALQSGSDTIGRMNNGGVWTPNSPGTFLVFTDVTFDGSVNFGIRIIKGSTSLIDTGAPTSTLSNDVITGIGDGFEGPATATAKGLVTINTGESIGVICINYPDGINISTPNPVSNATSHFAIQKVDPSKIVSYTMGGEAQTNIPANSVLKFSQLQAVSQDSIGNMQNGIWTCKSKGTYLIFTDLGLNNGGIIQLTAANNIIGTGYASIYTISTMGYAELNIGDNVTVKTLTAIDAISSSFSQVINGHLIIYKID
jgi:PKD repeat protein